MRLLKLTRVIFLPFAFLAIGISSSNVYAQDEKTWTDHYWDGPDGLKFHYLEQGEGTPIILIHGLGSSAKGNWFNTGVAQKLAQTNRVIAIDMRGHGETPKPPASVSGNMVQDITALMQHLKIDKAHIGGYSMGGAITIGLIKYAPDKFITASILGAGVQASEGWVKVSIRGTPLENDAKMQAGVDLAEITFPVLGINGELDRPEQRRQELAALENLTFVVIPGKNHGNTPRDPAFAEAFAEFIAKHN